MADKIVYDVDLIRDVKLLLVSNTDVTVSDNALRNKIKSLGGDVLVRVGKKLGSLVIVSVDVIDDTFLNAVLK